MSLGICIFKKCFRDSDSCWYECLTDLSFQPYAFVMGCICPKHLPWSGSPGSSLWEAAWRGFTGECSQGKSSGDVAWGKVALSSPGLSSSWSEAADSAQPPPQPVSPPAGGVRTSVLGEDGRGMSQHLALQMLPAETGTEMETGKHFRR